MIWRFLFGSHVIAYRQQNTVNFTFTLNTCVCTSRRQNCVRPTMSMHCTTHSAVAAFAANQQARIATTLVGSGGGAAF